MWSILNNSSVSISCYFANRVASINHRSTKSRNSAASALPGEVLRFRCKTIRSVSLPIIFHPIRLPRLEKRLRTCNPSQAYFPLAIIHTNVLASCELREIISSKCQKSVTREPFSTTFSEMFTRYREARCNNYCGSLIW